MVHVNILYIIGRSVPSFVFAVVLQLVFSDFPNSTDCAMRIKGLVSSIPSNNGYAGFLPSLIAFVRTEMVLHSDYIELRVRRACRFEVAFKHGFSDYSTGDHPLTTS